MSAVSQKQQGQKRKAGASDAGGAPQVKKAREEPKQPPPQQQPQGKQGKKAKQPEPEPEEEDEDADEGEGERDEAALAAIAKVQPQADAIADEMSALEQQEQAEIFAIQKKFLLKKRPLLAKRDALLRGVKGLWAKIFQESQTISAQLEEVDAEILPDLLGIEEEQVFASAESKQQQITGLKVVFHFAKGQHTKAGKFTKEFKFDDATEGLTCVPTPAKDQPFLAADFASKHPDSFFHAWFSSEDVDHGILAAQDHISSELLVDPLQLYAHLAAGNAFPTMDDEDMDDEDDEAMAAMAQGDSDDEDDGEAPELVD